MAGTSTPFPARHPHRVAILVLDTVVPFDLGVPCQIFGRGRKDLGAVRYQAAVCARAPGPVPTSVGVSLNVTHGLEAIRDADTVIVAGVSDPGLPVPREIRGALQGAVARGARVASICTGAFVLADAGLLDGRRATTHWADAPLLAARYPAVRVDPDVLYVDEGQVLTSAGLAAGIDLCLHLVRRDYGAEVANAVARRMVVPPHRRGGQAQYARVAVPPPTAGGLEETREWMLQHVDEPLTLQALARRSGMSQRTFSRRFRDETGTSPLQWLVHQRVLLAQRLLERTGESMQRIADRCGFGSPLVLRTHFRRALHTSPSEYRTAFRGTVRAEGRAGADLGDDAVRGASEEVESGA